MSIPRRLHDILELQAFLEVDDQGHPVRREIMAPPVEPKVPKTIENILGEADAMARHVMQAIDGKKILDQHVHAVLLRAALAYQIDRTHGLTGTMDTDVNTASGNAPCGKCEYPLRFHPPRS